MKKKRRGKRDGGRLSPGAPARLKGLLKADAAVPRHCEAGPQAGAFTTRLDKVKDVPRPWLWPGRIPLGELVVFMGDPQAGKSGFTFSLAARVTAGRPWPDGADNVAGNVLFVAAEDSLASTRKARLRGEGGRMRRVHVVTAPPDLSTPDGLAVLDEAIADSGGVRLVVIDPLTACIPAINGEVAVRRVMTGLRTLAERHRATVAVVLHTGKEAGGRRPIHRALGSVAFTGVPRVVYAVGPDPAGDGTRLMVPVKFSFGPMPTALRFRITGRQSAADVGVVKYLAHDVAATADEVLRASAAKPQGSYERVEQFLRQQLAAGPLPQASVRERAEREGIAQSTVERVKRRIGVRSFHPTWDRARWWYALPGAGSQTGASGSSGPARVGDVSGAGTTTKPHRSRHRRASPGVTP